MPDQPSPLPEIETDYWKLQEDPTWRPYCLMCRSTARMTPDGGTFKCKNCGTVVDRAMRPLAARSSVGGETPQDVVAASWRYAYQCYVWRPPSGLTGVAVGDVKYGDVGHAMRAAFLAGARFAAGEPRPEQEMGVTCWQCHGLGTMGMQHQNSCSVCGGSGELSPQRSTGADRDTLRALIEQWKARAQKDERDAEDSELHYRVALKKLGAAAARRSDADELAAVLATLAPTPGPVE